MKTKMSNAAREVASRPDAMLSRVNHAGDHGYFVAAPCTQAEAQDVDAPTYSWVDANGMHHTKRKCHYIYTRISRAAYLALALPEYVGQD